MNSSDFYATAAQVLPTIMIALAVEYGFLLQRDAQEREWERRKRRELESAKGVEEAVAGMERAFVRVGKYAETWHRVAYATSIVFLVGEVLAVLSLAFGWSNVATGAIILTCMVVLTVATAYVPLARIRSASRL
ncbi:hypothetical protein ACFMQL_20395 [Nonomuraea fastidiosa]|uniref:hypothetical protein n=1 Tax=Nonomuraea fastidiosa TaxID=46173 RepID=UPI00366B0351